MNKVLLVFAAAIIVTGCGSWCKDTVKKEVPVSDGKYMARVVERNCGAMTHYLTVVQVRERHLLFTRTQEVFQADNPHELKLEWQGEHLLKIQCLDCIKGQVREAKKDSLGVKIDYKLQSGDAD